MTPTAAGFVPQQNNTLTGPKPTPAPMAAPAPKENPLKTLEGKIASMDDEHRTFQFQTEEFSVKIEWQEYLDVKMVRFKPSYKAKITYERAGNTNTLIDIVSLFKPAGAGGWSGKSSYAPRNDRIIALQSSLKVCADLFQSCTCPDTQDYDTCCDVVYAKALELTERIMKDGVAK